MTEERKDQEKRETPLEKLRKTAYSRLISAEVAERLENSGLAKIALDRMNLSGDAQLLMSESEYYRTTEGIASASKIWAAEAKASRYEQKIGTLFEKLYKKGIDKLEKETKTKVTYVFNQFKDNKLGDIINSYNQAKKNLGYQKDDDLKGRFTEEEFKKYEGVVKKYETFVNAYESVHEGKLASIQFGVTMDANSKVLQEIVKDVKIPQAPSNGKGSQYKMAA